jgi:signal transduction histidine kinase
MVNAAKHTGAPVSVFVEVADGRAEIFVRDRGDGFDLDAIPADRLGVRESIIGRMERNGGSATIRTGDGDRNGTEVRLLVEGLR